MKEDKKLIVTVTQNGKPLYATQCKLLIGSAMLDDIGNANCFLFGTGNLADLAVVAASLYDMLEDLEKQRGPEFKTLVELARQMGELHR